MINIGDLVKHRYNTSEEQSKVVGVVVDISKAVWDDEMLVCDVHWLNSPYRTANMNMGHAKGYRFQDLEKVS
jgi:hypothetical protein